VNHYWLYWVVTFLGVVALLALASALQEWWEWRKKKPPPR
jgi:hypothetical protein